MSNRGPTSRSPGADALRELYEEHELSYAEIARRFGVTKTTVKRWLRAAGIPARDKATSTRLGMREWQPSEEHKQRLRENAAKARAAITPASYRKQAQKMRGRTAPNKGKSWSDETRAKHAYRQTPEYRKKMAQRLRGENAPNWRGGQTDRETLRMQGWEWRQRRRECYERDNWTCRDCGRKCNNGVRIAAHHVIPRRHGGTDELENLLTLCGSCHSRRESLYRAAFIA